MRDQRSLFQSLIGEPFTLEHPDRPFLLTLKEVTPLASTPSDGFSLLFESSDEEICPKGVYPIKADGFEAALFIVPMGTAEQGFAYEIILN